MPTLEMVETPSWRPTTICPAMMTSPVEWVSPAKVTSTCPAACIIRAVYMGSLALRLMVLALFRGYFAV